MRFVSLVATVATLFVVGFVDAQCVGPECGISVKRVRIGNQEYPDQFPLFIGNEFVGSVDIERRVFQPYDRASETWGPVVALDAKGWAVDAKGCKCDKCACLGLGNSWRENGVYQDKLRGSRITINGRDIVGDPIPDDSKKLTVTVIGTKADRDKAAAELRTHPDAERFNVWSVPPDHHSLKDTETGKTVYKTDGTPTLYVQAPDGKVLHRQDDAVNVVDAVRKAVKGYDAAKDPDLRKAHPSPKPTTPDAVGAFPTCCLMAAIAVLLYLSRRNQR